MINEDKISWPEKCPICSGTFVIHPHTNSGRVCDHCSLGIHCYWPLFASSELRAKPGNFLFWFNQYQIVGEEMTFNEFQRRLKLESFK